MRILKLYYKFFISRLSIPFKEHIQAWKKYERGDYVDRLIDSIDRIDDIPFEFKAFDNKYTNQLYNNHFRENYGINYIAGVWSINLGRVKNYDPSKTIRTKFSANALSVNMKEGEYLRIKDGIIYRD